MQRTQWKVEKIIETAICLQRTGRTGASTGEQIAAAFVLDRQDMLPSGYTMFEAWERLDKEWQGYVMIVRGSYMHLIEEEAP